MLTRCRVEGESGQNQCLLYIPKGEASYDALKPMIGGTLNISHVRAHWDEVLRLAASMKVGAGKFRPLRASPKP